MRHVRCLGSLVVLLVVASAAAGQTPRSKAPDGTTDKKQNASRRPEPDRRSLKEAVGDRFKIGVGVDFRVVEQPEDAGLIGSTSRSSRPKTA